MDLKYTHGGNVYNNVGENVDVIDFSANINPLGIPENAKKAIIDSIDLCENYPDPFSKELRLAISKFDNIDYDNIICGNGAGDIIFRVALALKPKKAMILAPTFSEYETALKTVDCEVFYHSLYEENDFSLTDNIIDELDSSMDMIFICNPNNPTGQLADKSLVEKIISTAKEKNIFVVVDECFIEFVDNGTEYTVKGLVEKYDNILILKAFTKIFAVAGLRLGYAFTSNNYLMEKLYEVAQPWSVSVLAQKVGVACLKEEEYLQATMQLVKEQRSYLKAKLEEIGLKVMGSNANYVFFKSKDENLTEKTKEKNILIRSCSNYVGLTGNYYRVAVKTKENNKALIMCLKEICSK